MARVSRTKQVETLQKMKDRRAEDTIFLRDHAKQKLDWAINEKQKGIEAIQQHEQVIEGLKKQVQRLEGYAIALKELVSLTKDTDKEKSSDSPQN